MALDKAILHGKEHRKPYKGVKAYDSQCCNHGSCDRCRDGRLYQYNKMLAKANQKMMEFEYCERHEEENSVPFDLSVYLLQNFSLLLINYVI